MSGISIEIGLRDRDAESQLQTLLDRMENRRGFYASVGERLLSSSKDRFREENAPDGTPWTPLRPRTIKAREGKGQTPITILRSNTKGKSGSSLAGSLNYDATNEEVRVGSPLPYAAIHQLGGTIQKPESTRWMSGRRFAKRSEAPEGKEVKIPAHKITIPSRPFLGLTAGDEEGILEDAADWLTR
ncbi:phage virion morphogenesis protein [Thalassovita sp.]|uniref:phage virion morphogenesis protein n=1 Tax=Thalassovita sp. TaxID=1979401 RepID=UPI002B274C41|nr:phage virion morphogenesis protein [Thalassovita sp.]